jgi:hypothetical protein
MLRVQARHAAKHCGSCTVNRCIARYTGARLTFWGANCTTAEAGVHGHVDNPWSPALLPCWPHFATSMGATQAAARAASMRLSIEYLAVFCRVQQGGIVWLLNRSQDALSCACCVTESGMHVVSRRAACMLCHGEQHAHLRTLGRQRRLVHVPKGHGEQCRPLQTGEHASVPCRQPRCTCNKRSLCKATSLLPHAAHTHGPHVLASAQGTGMGGGPSGGT